MVEEQNQNLREKKLRGSGGFVFAHVTDEEQMNGNLGGPELFLAGIGRLPSERFIKYHCNKCDKDYKGSPKINYENPNEDLGEGVILYEKGEYMCDSCNNIIAQYRKFDTQEKKEDKSTSTSLPKANQESDINSASHINTDTSVNSSPLVTQNVFISIQSLIGMPAYDWNAMLIGNVQEIGLKRTSKGKMEINLKIPKKSNNKNVEVAWQNISKIGDIILLENSDSYQLSKCSYCSSQNESDAVFCAECGRKLANES